MATSSHQPDLYRKAGFSRSLHMREKRSGPCTWFGGHILSWSPPDFCRFWDKARWPCAWKTSWFLFAKIRCWIWLNSTWPSLYVLGETTGSSQERLGVMWSWSKSCRNSAGERWMGVFSFLVHTSKNVCNMQCPMEILCPSAPPPSLPSWSPP